MNANKPGQKLWNEIKGAFVTKGQSLPEWCLANGINHSNLAKNCLGQRNGKKALWWRHRVILHIKDIKEIEISTPCCSNCGGDN